MAPTEYLKKRSVRLRQNRRHGDRNPTSHGGRKEEEEDLLMQAAA
jgi:hypothetical protein